jgi:tetratricopeptide (TPR) repeat protein
MEIYTRAQIEAEKGNLTEAINIIETGIKKNERDAAYYLFHGTYVYYQNPEENAQTALEEFKISYKSNQDNYINNMVIGMCYFTMKDYENAVSFYEKANSLYTEEQDAPPVYYELAESYFQNGQIEEALKINTLALEKDPNYSWNYMQRGIILSQDGNKNILFENYRKAIEKDSSELELHKEYIKRLIELKYYNDALEFCNELLEFNNSYDWCYSFLGLISMLDGNMDEGKNYLEKAFSINDKNIDTLSYLSFYYYFIIILLLFY